MPESSFIETRKHSKIERSGRDAVLICNSLGLADQGITNSVGPSSSTTKKPFADEDEGAIVRVLLFALL